MLVIGDAPGAEDALVGRLARFYAYGDLNAAGDRHPLYLIPHLPVDSREAEARAALAFVRERFAVPDLPVAGVDAGGGTALRLALDGGAGVGAVMVLAGGRFDPWPGEAPATLAARLAPLAADLPVDWTDFARETARTGGAQAVLQALRSTGVDLTERNAGGSLGLSQAADRIVLWAEEMPVPGGEK